MKIAGIDLSITTNIIVPIIRGDSEVIFECCIIESYDDFDRLCPAPEAPKVLRRGDSAPTPDETDKDYLEALEAHSKKRVAYMFIVSVEPTEGLTWDKVDLANPDTWEFYENELTEAGFNTVHMGQILQGVMEANGLSDTRIEEAKKRFLAAQRAAQSQPSSPTVES